MQNTKEIYSSIENHIVNQLKSEELYYSKNIFDLGYSDSLFSINRIMKAIRKDWQPLEILSPYLFLHLLKVNIHHLVDRTLADPEYRNFFNLTEKFDINDILILKTTDKEKFTLGFNEGLLNINSFINKLLG